MLSSVDKVSPSLQPVISLALALAQPTATVSSAYDKSMIPPELLTALLSDGISWISIAGQYPGYHGSTNDHFVGVGSDIKSSGLCVHHG